MSERFNCLSAGVGSDGASTSDGIRQGPDVDDVQQLLEAWSRERHDRIESSLMLYRVRRLLRKIIADGTLTSGRQRQVKGLLSVIEELERGERADCL